MENLFGVLFLLKFKISKAVLLHFAEISRFSQICGLTRDLYHLDEFIKLDAIWESGMKLTRQQVSTRNIV